MPPKFRKVILLTHLFGGLIAALTLTLLGVSGGLLVFENEINHALNGRLTWVQPGGTPLSFSELSRRLEERHPRTQVSNIIPSSDEKVAYTFSLRGVAKGVKSLSVAVNQYTGEELGTTDTANTFTQKLHQFHTNLLLGPKGKQITMWSAAILLIMAVSGLIPLVAGKIIEIQRLEGERSHKL